ARIARVLARDRRRGAPARRRRACLARRLGHAGRHFALAGLCLSSSSFEVPMSFAIRVSLVAAIALSASTACVVKEIEAPPPSPPPVTTSDGQPIEEEGDAEVGVEPPAPQPEPAAVGQPSPQHVWIAGHWAWRGKWMWFHGHWALGSPGATWIPGHWHRGPKNHWHW